MATKKKSKKQASKAKKRAPTAPSKKAKPVAKSFAKKGKRPAVRPSAKVAARKAPSRGKPVAKAARKGGKQAVKALAKAAVRKRSTARTTAATRKPPTPRRDGAGHLDAKYAAELRATRGRPEVEPANFLNQPRSRDDLVEELGEEFIATATSGEYEAEDALNKEVPEERGGPFVETTSAEEFADDVDASNPKGADREPFPTT